MARVQILLLLGLLAACSGFPERGNFSGRVAVARLSKKTYAAKESWLETAVLESVQQPHGAIARLTIRGNPDDLPQELIRELRVRASKLGADALIQIRTGWTTGESLRTFEDTLQADYGFYSPAGHGGAVSSGRGSMPWASAVAVVYLEKNKPLVPRQELKIQ